MSDYGWPRTDKQTIEIVTTFRDGTESRVTIPPPDDPATMSDQWCAQIDEFGNIWLPENDDGETTVYA